MEDSLALFGSILLALGVVSLTFIIGALRRVSNKQNPNINGIGVLQLLGDLKPFPIDANQGWSLTTYVNSHRLWSKELEASHLVVPFLVHGCYSRVRGSAQSILNVVKDITKYQEWEPALKHVKAVTVAEETRHGLSETKTPKGLPVQHDIISADSDFIANAVVQYLNKISCMTQGESLLRKTCIIHRYWHKEENGSCWLLEIDEELQEWCFYLSQPLQGIFEMDQCMVTVIHCPHKARGPLASHIPAVKLASLQHYLTYRKLQCIPLNTISLPINEEPECLESASNTSAGSPSKSRNIFGDFTRLVNPEEKSPEGPTLLSKFKNLIEEKKEWYEKEKKRRQSTPSPSPKNETAANILQHSPAKGFLHQFAQRARGQGSVEQNGSEDEIEESPGTGTGNARRSLFKMLRSNTVTGVVSLPDSQTESHDEEFVAAGDSSAPADNIDIIDQLHSIGSGLGDLKLETSCKTAMNQAAADIMAEKVRVANIDITKPYEEQAEQTGGWIYCGLEKDIVILRKIHDESSPVQSYLGKGMIPVPPKTVFEGLKNPRTRYTYDEMLKKMEVLHDFGNGLKVIHLHHEICQLFKKEARDFCILQNERVEGSKYVISMRSVGWSGCPEVQDTVRGKFLSSGWIIEPCVKDNKTHSMVTYIVQMELASHKSSNGYLVEELAAKQPLSIAFLRQYLVPSTAINRSSSSQQLPRRKQTTTTLASVAAAASQSDAGTRVVEQVATPVEDFAETECPGKAPAMSAEATSPQSDVLV